MLALLLEVLRDMAPDAACIAALAGLHPIIDRWLPVHAQWPFSDDRSIMRAYALRETVPTWGQWVAGFVLPLVLVGAIAALRYPRRGAHVAAAGAASGEAEDARPGRAWLRETLLCVAGLSVAALLALDVTNVVKAFAGRPRPDFMQRCMGAVRLDARPADAGSAPPTLVTAESCTGDAKVVLEGFKSFPSGHAASAFAGCVFAALVIACHGQLFPGTRTRASRDGRSPWVLAATLPLAAALFTALSRHADNRHHAGDIAAGALLGTGLALAMHRIYCCRGRGEDASGRGADAGGAALPLGALSEEPCAAAGRPRGAK